jgi:hypothetical protein
MFEKLEDEKDVRKERTRADTRPIEAPIRVDRRKTRTKRRQASVTVLHAERDIIDASFISSAVL